MSAVVMVMPDMEKAFAILSTVSEVCFIASTLSNCMATVAEGPQTHFWDASEAAALLTTELEPEIADALCLPQLTHQEKP